MERFKSAVALDLSLGLYTIPLDEESQKMDSTILLWGECSYLRMLMGVACVLSMFQSILIDTLRSLDVLVYIYDILVIQQEYELTSDYLIIVKQVLQQLELVGFKANLRKSFFMQKSVKYLGY